MATIIISGQAPGAKPTFVATSAPQPQLTYIDVIEDPRTQRGYNRWTNGHNAHSATVGKSPEWKRPREKFKYVTKFLIRNQIIIFMVMQYV